MEYRKCKNLELKNELVEALNQLDYNQYVEWYSELGFTVNNTSRFKEVRNRISANRIVKENPGKCKICPRCEGKGRLKEFITVMNPGTCFKCRGFGFVNID